MIFFSLLLKYPFKALVVTRDITMELTTDIMMESLNIYSI